MTTYKLVLHSVDDEGSEMGYYSIIITSEDAKQFFNNALSLEELLSQNLEHEDYEGFYSALLINEDEVKKLLVSIEIQNSEENYLQTVKDMTLSDTWEKICTILDHTKINKGQWDYIMKNMEEYYKQLIQPVPKAFKKKKPYPRTEG